MSAITEFTPIVWKPFEVGVVILAAMPSSRNFVCLTDVYLRRYRMR